MKHNKDQYPKPELCICEFQEQDVFKLEDIASSSYVVNEHPHPQFIANITRDGDKATLIFDDKIILLDLASEDSDYLRRVEAFDFNTGEQVAYARFKETPDLDEDDAMEGFWVTKNIELENPILAIILEILDAEAS